MKKNGLQNSSMPTHTTCTSSVEVYAWLMDKANCFGGEDAFMVAYGKPIHLLWDKAMLHPDGSYIDDDFDTWVTVPTVSNVVSLNFVSFYYFPSSCMCFILASNDSKFGTLSVESFWLVNTRLL